MLIEIFGYIGSAIVVISMLMTSIVKLRVFSTIGSIVSGIYAVICHAIPLALMNACLIIINIVGLVKLLKTEKSYSLVVGKADGALVKFFIDYYENDIKTYFPHFNKEEAFGHTAYFVCHEGVPAGVLIGNQNGSTFDINIEYTTPKYRDCSVGKYLYSTIDRSDIKTLRYVNKPTEAHISYMEKMGYELKDGLFEKDLSKNI